jgi:16S rRNA processing protein RimM
LKTYVSVGKLGKTRGVDGELYVIAFTDFPDRFMGMKEIYVGNEGSWKLMSIASTRMIAGRPVMRFEGYDSPEDARRLTNLELAVPENELVELPEGMYFLFELVGCLVIDDATGDEIGEIVEVQQYPANDVYIIRRKDDTEAMLPAVHAFVKQIDIDGKRIRIDPAGLIENVRPSGNR